MPEHEHQWFMSHVETFSQPVFGKPTNQRVTQEGILWWKHEVIHGAMSMEIGRKFYVNTYFACPCGETKVVTYSDSSGLKD